MNSSLASQEIVRFVIDVRLVMDLRVVPAEIDSLGARIGELVC